MTKEFLKLLILMLPLGNMPHLRLGPKVVVLKIIGKFPDFGL